MLRTLCILALVSLMNIAHAEETAVIETSLGTFEAKLYRSDAPKTVENFTKLSQQGYFNGILFHRISRGFVIQAGDPQTKDKSLMNRWGTGGTSIYGAKFEDELNKNTQSYKDGYQKGVLAMANAGPNTNGSQFFVLLEDQTSWMPHQYTIFGAVTKGMDVVTKIGEQPIVDGENDGRPAVDIVIKSITIKQ